MMSNGLLLQRKRLTIRPRLIGPPTRPRTTLPLPMATALRCLNPRRVVEKLVRTLLGANLKRPLIEQVVKVPQIPQSFVIPARNGRLLTLKEESPRASPLIPAIVQANLGCPKL